MRGDAGTHVLTFLVPRGCSATCGCSCVRSYRVFLASVADRCVMAA